VRAVDSGASDGGGRGGAVDDIELVHAVLEVMHPLIVHLRPPPHRAHPHHITTMKIGTKKGIMSCI
jgi:hypothetical protein